MSKALAKVPSSPSAEVQPTRSLLPDSTLRTGELLFLAALACLIPTALEAGSLLSFRKSLLEHVPISPSAFVFASTLTTFVVAFAHVLPIVLFERWLTTKLPGLARWLWPLLAGVLVFAMQNAALRGDGARSSAYYPILAPLFAFGAPVAAMGVVFVLVHGRRLSVRMRRLLLIALLLEGWIFNLLVLTRYQQFHGYLTAFNVVLSYLTLREVSVRFGRASRTSTWSALALSLALATTLSDFERTSRAVVRYTHFAASLAQSLPFARPFIPPALAAVQAEQRIPEDAARRFEARLTPKAARGAPLGRNVLLIVLESTRWDDWADPKITPHFHQWRRHGVYFPQAVASFPATTLGYGAMFTGQPPSVLTATPLWAARLPFRYLSSRFDEFLLTRPVDLPEHIDIAEYFAEPSDPVNEHRNAQDALDYLRRKLTELDEETSFFAWAHLYEPHHPWEVHREHLPEDANPPLSRYDAYRTELRYMDAQLGKFMTWFYEQSFAEDTLVIAIADHGEGMGDIVEGKPFHGHNAHPHTAVAWIPAFLSGRGLPANLIVEDRTFSQLDVMPTLFDFFAQSEPPELSMQGLSVYDLLESAHDLARPLVTEVFGVAPSAFFDNLTSVRDRGVPLANGADVVNDEFTPQIALQRANWKFHHDLLLDRFRLYDLATDPAEQHDLAEQRPDKLAEMRAALDEWRLQQAWVIQRMEQNARSSVGSLQ